MYMRFIVLLLLVYNGSVFSQQIECGDDYNSKKYTYKQFEITICDCRCTIQENVFFVKKSDSGLVYKVNGASRIVVNDRDLIEDEPAIRFFLSTKNKCSEDTVVKKDVISFLTLLPSENGQPCYEYSAYIDSIGNLQVLKDYISVQLFETIVPEKQFLYNENNRCTQTKMYLIKGDKVEVLKEEGEWLYILYNGTKEIRKWIPKCAVE